MNSKNDILAKIDNTFILNAQYRMSAREQKVLYYLISHLDPKNEKEFNIINVPIRQIEETLKEGDSKWGNFYEQIDTLCESLMKKSITFPTKSMIEGKNAKGRINFFSSIIPQEDENGQTNIRFSFAQDMKPFLLQLHHYVNIGVLEVVPMKNAHAIRMYSVFKSAKDRLKDVKKVVNMTYTIVELKALLGISDKYEKHTFKDFRINVLDKIKDEINTKCDIMAMSYECIKTHRKTTGVSFTIYEKSKVESKPKKEVKPKLKKDTHENYIPSEADLNVLTRAKIKAYETLKKYGVYEGIAYKQIIPTIKGSEIEGYEDIFIQYALSKFEKSAIQTTTQDLKAGTFVTWWTKNKIFESGEAWAEILEKIVKYKKDLMRKDMITYENRIIAKTMTNKQFMDYVAATKKNTENTAIDKKEASKKEDNNIDKEAVKKQMEEFNNKMKMKTRN